MSLLSAFRAVKSLGPFCALAIMKHTNDDFAYCAYTDYSSVLDLYAGTGALGIEALSRGAMSSDFVGPDLMSCL